MNLRVALTWLKRQFEERHSDPSDAESVRRVALFLMGEDDELGRIKHDEMMAALQGSGGEVVG
jgi:hypothetical protein